MIMNLIELVRGRINQIASISNAVGTLMLFGLVAVLNIDVFARGVLHAPLKGSVEIVVFSLVLIVFLQLPDVIRCDRLTRSDGFLAYAKQRHPALASYASRLIDISSSVFMGLIAWTVWPEFLETYESCYFFAQPEFGPAPTGVFLTDLSDAFARCEYFGTPGIFTAPTWPLHLATVFGVSLSCLILLLKAVLGGRELLLVHMEEGEKSPEELDSHDSR